MILEAAKEYSYEYEIGTLSPFDLHAAAVWVSEHKRDLQVEVLRLWARR